MKISKKCVPLQCIFQTASESVPHVSLTVPVPFIIDCIHYGALRPVMMDTVILRVATILSLLYACTYVGNHTSLC